ncbi:TetR family transcriptional regulator C-terminal domain-containing protein [Rhodococcus fascians]|nr:TetR family transcriptional regulator C-terminal domain-containing protein [Rhodococcus fascians]MBY3826535.1 TetR family transcriptional regulator C-terminal domain-containing protein [Rhodococcus fascians]MBY3836996.1 TetR family transcriptional regulator C-terminal domain-containing protein [Rhodococcus fascians]MBY3865537.1 TetR family transcriptional regulator C-terminal domain-containing protein [Rhodococcus fascians]MBY3885677.1 TetR family transcriptional regulator C-terminal domain-
MTLSATAITYRRKDPQSRRQELADAAGRLAVSNGLGQLTAKKVADEVGVYPGLVTHYFKTSDGLIAAAFAAAVENRRARLADSSVEATDALDRLRTFLDDATDPSHDAYALLWLDAWRESTRRPALQDEVVRQMEFDIDNLIEILELGCRSDQFAAKDCAASAMRILAIIDGTFGQSAVRTALSETSAINYPIVTDMVFRHAEGELGLSPGRLHHGGGV